jgi:HlyD family secretion protein
MRSPVLEFAVFTPAKPKLARAATVGWAFAVSTLLVSAAGCSRPPQPDAYGNVEATEVVVGAEAGGRILSLTVNEGQKLAAQAVVGAIDSAQLALERDQLAAQHAATASRVNEVGQQIDVLRAQRSAAAAQRDAATAQRGALVAQQEIARRVYERTQRLFSQQAATAQQLDQAEKDDRVLADQIKAQDEQIKAQERQIVAQTQQIEAIQAQRQTAREQVKGAEAQVAQAGERIRKSQVTNPIAGTVLTTYARAGEMVQPGQPLYKIADLETVEVRAYVTEPQLSNVKIGHQAQVTIDVSGRREVLTGTISWVSTAAEFTPTPIQTRDERADLVYAIKIRVSNPNGALKIGMPVDVRFVPPGSSSVRPSGAAGTEVAGGDGGVRRGRRWPAGTEVGS